MTITNNKVSLDGDGEVVTLAPARGADGCIVWREASIASTSHAPSRDVSPRADGRLGLVTGATAKPLSTLPRDRMAADAQADLPAEWTEIISAIRRSEDGQPARDVTAAPGGQLQLAIGGQTRPLSSLPKARMASQQHVSAEDVKEIMRIDPMRIERWSPVDRHTLCGWTFELRPAPNAEPYNFLAFRSPNDSNLWRIFVLKPDMDNRFGHADHICRTEIGGHSIPVVCGPGGRADATLAAARATAAKWMAYTFEHARTGVAPFSA